MSALKALNNDEFLTFSDENDKNDTPDEKKDKCWKILIVDDDEEVHAATKFALSDILLLGRPLEFIDKYNGEEALEFLSKEGNSDDIAVILLDVVMETEDAGLRLAKKIRDELKLSEVRIVLRTGQPGYAPDIEVIRDYDINDYRTKSELTQNRLVTTLTTAIRSYRQIRAINYSRQGLELIVNSAADLLEKRALESFCEGVLGQITALLGLPREGIICAQRGSPFDDSDADDLYIIAAAGQYSDHINHRLSSIENPEICNTITRCIEQGAHQFNGSETVLYLRSMDKEAAIFLSFRNTLEEVDLQLIRVFTSNISVLFENVNLFQKERFTAYYDPLSKLPNRHNFTQILDNYVKNYKEPWSAALIDIDHFADINEALGQDIGNELIRNTASRLESELGTGCCLARISADVFGILGPDSIVNPDRILGVFSESLRAGEHLLPIGIAVGLCRSSQAGQTGLHALNNVSIALNYAKKNPQSKFQYYREDMQEKTSWRLNMIRQLREAFKNQQLQVWYQPQIEVNTGLITGTESLLRWRSQDGTMISPAVFIPLAEYSGLIVEIGDWVLEQSLIALEKLHRHGFPHMTTAVNVSMPQFRAKDFVSNVAAALSKYDVDPRQVKLEITESIAMDEPKTVSNSLEQLKALGVKLSIDDFGTGYSSLSYLQQLPIDQLKVDRAFVKCIGTDENAVIAESVIGLGQGLKLKTLGEGVETIEQLRGLKDMGCNEIQGFLYSGPVPENELIDWLERLNDCTVNVA